jgi:hypothetical protein
MMSNIANLIRHRRKFAKLSKKRLHLWDLKQYKVCYIQNYKVATRSIRLSLAKFLLENDTPNSKFDYDLITDDQIEAKDNATKLFKHIHEVRSVCPEHFVFTFVRHPLARLQSCYIQKLLDATEANASDRFSIYGIDRNTTFERFVEIIAKVPDKHADRHFRSQHLLVNDGDRTICDFVGKFENLHNDWRQLQERFGFPDLPHRNKSRQRDSSVTAPSANIKRLIAQRYARDLDIFNYQL